MKKSSAFTGFFSNPVGLMNDMLRDFGVAPTQVVEYRMVGGAAYVNLSVRGKEGWFKVDCSKRYKIDEQVTMREE